MPPAACHLPLALLHLNLQDSITGTRRGRQQCDAAAPIEDAVLLLLLEERRRMAEEVRLVITLPASGYTLHATQVKATSIELQATGAARRQAPVGRHAL